MQGQYTLDSRVVITLAIVVALIVIAIPRARSALAYVALDFVPIVTKRNTFRIAPFSDTLRESSEMLLSQINQHK